MTEILNFLQFLVDYVAGIGLIGGFLVIVLESIIPIIPLSVFIGINVYNFGMVWGFVLSYVATIMGCLLSYCLFRFLLRDRFRFMKRDRVSYYVSKFNNVKLSTLVVIIAIPFTPAFAVNIAAGLSHMDFKKYLLALFIGKVSTIYFWGYVGTSLIDSIKNPFILIRIGIVLVLSYLICRIVQRIFHLEV
jgi:uncharacterized membrane protein YdjX (TVP38/TMEM64 family)